jgi:hypothetical protein
MDQVNSCEIPLVIIERDSHRGSQQSRFCGLGDARYTSVNNVVVAVSLGRMVNPIGNRRIETDRRQSPL